ncbi:MAG: hypothetical protein ACRDQF_02990 [Thermocrispum sp.]
MAVYDADFTWFHQDDFFLSVVNQTPQARVLDLGCGSGRVSLGMAEAGPQRDREPFGHGDGESLVIAL